MERTEEELREIRALAAVIYPSQAATGHKSEDAIENALNVAERIVVRSLEREQARVENYRRAQEALLESAGGGRNGDRAALSRRA